MGLWERYVVPPLVTCACATKPVTYQRRKIVPRAEGRVLEIGMGAGANLPFYDPARVTAVIGLEPSEGMRRRAAPAIAAAPFPVELIDLQAEEIPLQDASVDTVLVTFTLCTIPDAARALAGMRRVLKPGGRLLFCEHGRAPDENVRRWQDRVTPVWKRLFGGCHLNRAIPEIVQGAGFRIADIETMYLPSTPRIAGFNYWGAAEPA